MLLAVCWRGDSSKVVVRETCLDSHPTDDDVTFHNIGDGSGAGPCRRTAGSANYGTLCCSGGVDHSRSTIHRGSGGGGCAVVSGTMQH